MKRCYAAAESFVGCFFDGRIEKAASRWRFQVLPCKDEKSRTLPKEALTENVTPHGARVRTKQSGSPGEETV